MDNKRRNKLCFDDLFTNPTTGRSGQSDKLILRDRNLFVGKLFGGDKEVEHKSLFAVNDPFHLKGLYVPDIKTCVHI